MNDKLTQEQLDNIYLEFKNKGLFDNVKNLDDYFMSDKGIETKSFISSHENSSENKRLETNNIINTNIILGEFKNKVNKNE